MSLPPFVIDRRAVPDGRRSAAADRRAAVRGMDRHHAFAISPRWAFRCSRAAPLPPRTTNGRRSSTVISEGLARRAWPTESRDRQADAHRTLSRVRRSRRRRRRREEHRTGAAAATAGLHAVRAAAVADDGSRRARGRRRSARTRDVDSSGRRCRSIAISRSREVETLESSLSEFARDRALHGDAADWCSRRWRW